MKRLKLKRKEKNSKEESHCRFKLKRRSEQIKKTKLKRKRKEYDGPKFTKYTLKSRDRIEAMRIISEAAGYCSTLEDPKQILNPNHVYFCCSENQKEFWINLIEEKDPRILKVKVIDEYAIIALKGRIQENGYLVFTTEFYSPKLKDEKKKRKE